MGQYNNNVTIHANQWITILQMATLDFYLFYFKERSKPKMEIMVALTKKKKKKRVPSSGIYETPKMEQNK